MNLRLTLAAAVAVAAASLSLYPLVSGWLWFWEGAGAVAVAALAGGLIRLRALPAVAGAVAGLASVLLYLNAAFASAQAFGRIVPTGASLARLGQLAQTSLDQTNQFAPPAPAYRPILLLTVTGIGIVAVATDLIAVRLRRPALAGLPLLVLFCVPLTADIHQSIFGAMTVFGLGMAGYLGMLAVDGRERLRLWGHLVTVWHRAPDRSGPARTTPNTRELAAAGRRIGLAAVVIALFIPLLVPGLRDHKLFSGTGGRGGTVVSLPNPLVQMNTQLHRSTPVSVLTYQTASSSPQYLQVYVLSRLTTRTWTLTSAPGVPVHDGKLPTAPGLNPHIRSVTRTVKITLAKGLTTGPHTASFLPLPYPARDVDVPGNWRSDPRTLTMFSAQSLSGLSYSVTSRELSPTPAQLRAAGPIPASIANNYLSVPAAFLPLTKLAEQITKGQATGYDQAVALQRWFADSGKFSYRLDVAEPSTAEALISFLTKQRRGYCQQFAFAMAVLARLLGIPARVAVGYTGGSPLGHDRWEVKTSDAHAWPELYFQGVGWLRFEPTPAGADGQATAVQPAYTLLPTELLTPGGNKSTPTPTASAPTAGATPGNAGALAKLQHLSGTSSTGGAGRSSSLPVAPVVAVLAGLVLVTPRSARSLTRRHRWHGATDDLHRAQVAWQEVLDDLTDHKISWSPSESPRALAARMAAALRLTPDQASALTRVAHAAERARYAREPADSASLRADTETVRRAVAAGSSRPTRWYARLLPASSLAPARVAVQHALDVFGWLDVAAHRAGGWSRRLPGREP
jgi:TgpA N-terminal domain/Transglutaminase-like superfamily/Domain of unknown function (DUF4129)